MRRIFGEFLDVLLRVSADDRAVNHPSQHAGGVLDRFAAPQLGVAGAEKQRLPAQFPDAHLEGNARARGGFGKEQRPDFARQRQRRRGGRAPFSSVALAARMCSMSSRDNFSMLNKMFHGETARRRIR